MTEKEGKHLYLYEYQLRYFEENNYNLSAIVRDSLDDQMIQDGADPEQWKKSEGDE